MTLLDAGTSAARAQRITSPWVWWQIALHPDVAPETGGLLPWRAGALYDHPVREVLAQRAIRAAWSDARKRRAKRKEG